MRVLRAQSVTTGISIATTGVLLRKALPKATGNTNLVWALRTETGRPRTWRMREAKAPVSLSAAATTKRAATVITPSLANPARAVAGVRTPTNNRNTTAPSNTKYGATFVVASTNTLAATVATLNQPWKIT